jgi:hypothetical protein
MAKHKNQGFTSQQLHIYVLDLDKSFFFRFDLNIGHKLIHKIGPRSGAHAPSASPLHARGTRRRSRCKAA